MLLDTKNSETGNKVYELREGSTGRGDPVYFIQTIYTSGKGHQEAFKSFAEAKNWWKFSCN